MELKEIFIGGLMNKDSDVRLIPDGEYIDAQNILVTNSNESSVGLVQKSNGFDKLTNLGLPLDATTIGSVAEEGNECLYWFVTSSAGNYIYEYNILDNNSLSVVLEDTRPPSSNVLNFDSNYKITGVNVIYNSFNKEKLLIWTDDLNPIRCINVNRSKSTPANQFSSKDISLYKRAPFEAPKCLPTQFGDGGENNIKERFLSFAYRYKYLDGEYSATSAFSNPQFYPSDFSFNFSTQENNGMVNSFNAINIQFNTGDKNVTDIQLLFKESNSNNIYVIENLNKNEEGYGNESIKSFLFSNNKIYSILPEDEVNRLYDNVPLVSKAQEFIGNRIMFGNYVEGRDLVDVDGDKIDIDFEVDFVAENLKNNSLNFTVLSNGAVSNVLNIELNPAQLKSGNIISISFRASSNSPYFGNYSCDLSYYLEKDYASAYLLSQSGEFISFIDKVASKNFENASLGNTEPANSVPSYVDKYKKFIILQSPSSNILSLKIPYIEHQIDLTPSNTSDSSFSYQNEFYQIKGDTVIVLSSAGNAYASCKSNRSYECGIVYLDSDGRYSTVLTSKNNTSFVPIKNSVTSNHLKLKINNKPPVWADRYKIFVKDSKLDYHTIYGVVAYQEGGFLWFKLEGQDKQKVKEGDYLIIKKSISGYSEEVVKLQVLDYVVKESDFIANNKNQAGDDIIEAPGVYIKVRSSADLNVGGVPKNFYNLEKNSADTGSNFFVFAGSETGFSINKGTPTAPIVEDIAITAGSRILIEITNTKGGSSGGNVEFKKEYIANEDYSNFETWFQTEADGLGDFLNYEFVRGTTTAYSRGGGLFGGLPRTGETIALNPNGYLYLKIKNVLNGNGQNRSFLNSKITITTGFSVLIFETDSDDNNSEVFFETQDTYLIQNGNHLARTFENPLDVNQGGLSNHAIINLNWFNCFTQGNGAESYVVKDVFNRNFLSTNSRPNAVQLDGYKERRNIASITYSGAFDKTTNYNSLNEFNLSRANYKDLDDKYGSIQKMHSRDTDLVVFQEDKVHRVLYNKNVLYDAIGGGQVSSIEDVLGQEIPFSGEWGISKNPESFAYYANSLYFTDSNKGSVLRLGGDGLEPISKYKMKDWFRDNLRLYKNNFKIGGFDPVHDKYIISLSDEESPFQSFLSCNQEIEWLNINANTSYIYTMEVGVNTGNHIVNYSIPSGSVFDFEVDMNGVVTNFNDRTGDGFITISKPTSGTSATLKIHNRENTAGSLSLENVCISNPELEVITLVVGDTTDAGKSMTNKYTWSNTLKAASGGSSLLDIFNVTSVTRFNSDTGLEGENEIPYNNSTIRVTSTKGTGEFTSCNRIGYLVSSANLTPQQILDSAIYPNVVKSGNDNYIDFTFTRTAGQKLHLVWDYIDVENCDKEPTPINLCYDEEYHELACQCDLDPVDCVVSAWSEWSECIEGTRTRTRTIVTPASNGGAACPTLSESESCSNPVNCVVSEWSEWTECSNGIRTRSRTIITQPSGGGTECPVLTETETCSSISIGSNNCNTLFAGDERVFKRFPINVGNPPLNYSIVQGQVTNSAGLPFTLVTTPGNSYLEVTFDKRLTLGNEFSMELFLKNESNVTVATNNTQTVYGDYQSFLPSCPSLQPVNCVVSEWSDWSTCTNGSQSRTRTVITPASNGGTACPVLTESRSCEPVIDCVVSEWSAWSTCSEGFRTRTRTVITPASGGGASCPVLSETETCSTIGVTSTICNDTDGGSTVTKRFRISIGDAPTGYTIQAGTVTNPAGLNYSIVPTVGDAYIQVEFKPSITFGNEFSIELLLKNSSGVTVATTVSQTLYGNYQSFLPSCQPPQPVNCVVSEWSAWSECVEGSQTRTRTVITPASNGGTACPVLSETQSCTVVSDRVAMNFYDDPCGTTIGLWYSTSEELYYTSEFGSTKYTGYAYTPLYFNQSDWEWEYYDINEGSALGPFTTFSGCGPY